MPTLILDLSFIFIIALQAGSPPHCSETKEPPEPQDEA